MAHLALVISNVAFSLYRLGARSAASLGVAHDGTELAGLLAANTVVSDDIALYTDLAEEAYVRSDLPGLWSQRMRDQLLARRLRQYFADQPYRAALVPPRAGRLPPRPGLASLFALPDLMPVQTALACVEERGMRLAGMWPLALMLARAVGRRDTLLVTAQLPSGLRHVLVLSGLAVFSRLSPHSGSGPAEGAAQWLADAQRTAQYLATQGWVGGAELRGQIWHELAAQPSAATAGAVLQVEEWRTEPDLYAFALRQRPPTQGQLLPPKATLAWRATRAGRVAMGFALIFLGIGAVWAALNEWDARQTEQTAASDRSKAQAAAAATEKILATAKGNLSQAGVAQAAVEAWTRLVQRQPDYAGAIGTVADVLQTVPDFQLAQLAWRAGPVVPADSRVSLPGQALLCDVAPPGTSGPAAAPTSPSAIEAAAPKPGDLTLMLVGQLPPEMALRQRIDAQQQIEEGLRRKGWRVRVVKPVVELGLSASSAGVVGQPSPASLEMCLSTKAV